MVVREQIARQIKGKSVSSRNGGPSEWKGGVRGAAFARTKEDMARGASRRGFAGELDGKKRAKKRAKCSKRWSWSGQVPPLVPTAEVKPNLLSAPFKRVPQDSGARRLYHPSPRTGTRRGKDPPPPPPLDTVATRPRPAHPPHPYKIRASEVQQVGSDAVRLTV